LNINEEERDRTLIKYHLVNAISSINISLLANDTRLLIQVDEHSGAIFLNSNINSTQLYAYIINKNEFVNSHNEFLLTVQVEAINFIHKSSQQHAKQAKSLLNMKLQFLECSSLDVSFERSYYHYLISESIRPGTIFGFVNSAQHLYNDHSYNPIVYSIIDGDSFDQFEIDYKTGMLLLQITFLFNIKP
jgi:hypothetical protein